MAQLNKIPKYATPVSVNLPQADAPTAGEMVLDLIQKNEALAWRHSGSGSKTLFYFPTGIGVGIANLNIRRNVGIPEARITVLNTWTDFVCVRKQGVTDPKNPSYQLPWYLSVDYKYVMAILTIYCQSSDKFSVRLSAQQLADHTFTTVDGDSVVARPDQFNRDIPWYYSSTFQNRAAWRTTVTLGVEPTSLPTERRIAIVPQIQLSADMNPAITLSGTVLVFIQQLTLMNLPEQNAGW